MYEAPHIDALATDNTPLQKGKISAMEGGTRVLLIITGPGIPRGVQTDVMANGLDFYPTILSWTRIPPPDGSRNPATKEHVPTEVARTRSPLHAFFVVS